jgi:hypothetical protein
MYLILTIYNLTFISSTPKILTLGVLLKPVNWADKPPIKLLGGGIQGQNTVLGLYAERKEATFPQIPFGIHILTVLSSCLWLI